MEEIFKFFPIIVVLIWIICIWYAIREHRSIINRARKIDPTVRTRAEAEYVLKKDVAQSVGKVEENK